MSFPDLTKKLSGKNELLKVFLLFSVIIILLMGNNLLPNKLLNSPSSDLDLIFTGKAELFINTIESGELPFWDPYTQSGIPFFSNPEITMVLYPLNWFFLIFKTMTIYNYLLIGHILLAGIFMYIFLRNKKIDLNSSLFGSFSYMLSGYIIATTYVGHYTQSVSYAYLPLMLYFVDRIINSGKYYNSILFGLLMTFVFFGSHMQFFVFSLIVSFLYAFYLLLKNNSLNIKNIFLFILPLIIFFGVSLIQFLPYMEFRNNINPYDYAASSDLSFTPIELVKLFIPNTFGSAENYLFITFYWESLLFVGSIASLMLFVLWMRRKSLDHTQKFFVMLFFVSLIFSFGKYLPLFEVIFNYVPLFSIFRSPVRLIFLSTFALSVLSAYSFSYFQKSTLQERLKLSKLTKYLSGIILSLVILGTLLKDELIKLIFYFYSEVFQNVGFVKRYTFDTLITERFLPGFNDFIFSAILTVLIFISFYFYLKRFDKKYILLPVLLLVLETGFYATTSLYSEDTNVILGKNDIVSNINPDEFSRFFNYKQYGVENYRHLDYFSYDSDLYNIGGDATLELKYYEDYIRDAIRKFENNDTSLIKKLGVKEIISPFILEHDDIVLIGTYDNFYLYEFTKVTPKAQFLNNGVVESFDRTINTMTITTNLDQNDELVITETYYPGWMAKCDGNNLNVDRNEIFISIDVPKNCSEIYLEFIPVNFYLYAKISLISFILSMLAVLILKKRDV